jgi:hypothetical protein
MVLLIRNVINTYVNVNKYRLVNICGPGLERMSKKYDAGKREGRGRIKLTVQLGHRDNALKFDHI